eukprot:CAMPEP_0172537464 /NCGR_PEP_ID=MMETSP1067-20121228/9057_1 /TAXON_ID=265564 ORGANISM="Thalassiosira punctigera, Strain Tpunct2005C2" /NCGR_SAMPLE_ID=MMETSP1067 /ASSEMBLY_ACC=CAM_ASM_000444 /LENGTH=222 /DNA_ID=CAMNT_0013322769 /DNA_START=79 /DNA_END=747 /DNA_ORIENTATION=-
MAAGEGPSTAMKCAALQSVFAITAFILMWIGSLNCTFIEFVDTSGTDKPMSIKFGLWFFQSWTAVFSVSGTYLFESCHYYPESIDLDDSWKTARLFSVIAFVLGIIILIGLCVSACTRDISRVTYGWEAPLYLLTGLCQGFTLFFLNSKACKGNLWVQLKGDITGVTFPDTCSISKGAKLTISAMVFFFAAGVTAFVAHKAEKKEIEDDERAGLREPLNHNV